jgi:hypothetical protein
LTRISLSWAMSRSESSWLRWKTLQKLSWPPLASIAVPRRVRPYDERHPEPLGVLAHPQVLREVALLRGGADVEGVADGVRAEADRFLHRRVSRRERVYRGRDVGLAVELEDQRYLAGVVPVELPGQADLDGDAGHFPGRDGVVARPGGREGVLFGRRRQESRVHALSFATAGPVL